ncbi:class I SAM-dependent methyltransferase [Hamadaea tsunoensis]|uniref:class I SAM-dependent methyltransferase n=1 Tax=Hamadaea tsunoensis TaxID=53368 RepID=UPI000413273D|nr:class I SAM-dependent methyltransferase [Hamadaea tsunoensis]
MTAGYAFTGTKAVPDQLAALTEGFDPFTRRSLSTIGIVPGWQVLEVGAGTGTIARWIADQLGTTGIVSATDIDTRYIPSHRAITALHHDIVTGELPADFYDVVHARLVLMHLRQREEVVRRLLGALRPGGVLVLHEFDCTVPRAVVCGDNDQVDLFAKVVDGINCVLDDAGARLDWGSTAARVLVRQGFTGVTVTAHAESFVGGSPWARLGAINTIQLADRLHGCGLSANDLYAFRMMMDDPRFCAMSYLMTCTVGRRPA